MREGSAGRLRGRDFEEGSERGSEGEREGGREKEKRGREEGEEGMEGGFLPVHIHHDEVGSDILYYSCASYSYY